MYSTSNLVTNVNEYVVQIVVDQVNSHFILSEGLPQCKHRGVPNIECGKFCYRFNPKQDNSANHFVACFQRIQEGMISEYEPLDDKSVLDRLYLDKTDLNDIDEITQNEAHSSVAEVKPTGVFEAKDKFTKKSVTGSKRKANLINTASNNKVYVKGQKLSQQMGPRIGQSLGQSKKKKKKKKKKTKEVMA